MPTKLLYDLNVLPYDPSFVCGQFHLPFGSYEIWLPPTKHLQISTPLRTYLFSCWPFTHKLKSLEYILSICTVNWNSFSCILGNYMIWGLPVVSIDGTKWCLKSCAHVSGGACVEGGSQLATTLSPFTLCRLEAMTTQGLFLFSTNHVQPFHIISPWVVSR